MNCSNISALSAQARRFYRLRKSVHPKVDKKIKKVQKYIAFWRQNVYNGENWLEVDNCGE